MYLSYHISGNLRITNFLQNYSSRRFCEKKCEKCLMVYSDLHTPIVILEMEERFSEPHLQAFNHYDL